MTFAAVVHYMLATEAETCTRTHRGDEQGETLNTYQAQGVKSTKLTSQDRS